MTSIQKPLDPRPTLTVYDQTFDRPTLITPLVGAQTQVTLNSVGDAAGVVRTSATETLGLSLSYDSFGNRLGVGNGLATYSNQTDANGLTTFVFDARNPETRTYDGRGRVAQRAFKSGRVLQYTYDNYDRVVEVQDSNGPTQSLNYDVMGRVVSSSVTDGTIVQTTQYVWDARDRLVETIDPLGNKTQSVYDLTSSGTQKIVIDKPQEVIDPLGHKTLFSYDNRQRLVKQTDAKNEVTTYKYNLRGDLVDLTDPLGHVTTFTFDANDRLQSQLSPSAETGASGHTTSVTQVSEYLYDLNGKLVEKRRLSSSSATETGLIDLTYDPFDRLIEKATALIDSKGNKTIQDDSVFTFQNELDQNLLVSANNQVEKLSFTNEAVPPFKSLAFSNQATDPKNSLGLIQGSYAVQYDVTNNISSIKD